MRSAATAVPDGQIIDITLGIETGMPVWPGDPPVVVEPVATLAGGDPASVSALRLGTHTGTHVDPPAHFVEGGATVDQLDLAVLVGPAVVVDLRGRSGPLEPADLEGAGLPAGVERVLLRTDNSARWDRPETGLPETWVAVSPAGARWLVDHGIRLVGVDALSIEAPTDDGYPVHRILLGAGVVLVEGLVLSHAEAGPYVLACLALKIVGGDGAPVRAVLVRGALGA
ncbi:MAG: cyclase family protein [Acidimicrobiales bacterium]